MNKKAHLLALMCKAAITCLVLMAIGFAGNSSGNAAMAQSFDMNGFTQSVSQGALGSAIGRAVGGAIGGATGHQIAQATQGSSNPNLPMTSTGAYNLSVVSTGSIDLNTCDLPFIKSNGGSGAFPTAGSSSSAGGSSDGSGGNQAMPNLPPGYIGVQNSHDGSFMGAIPPGGNIVDFFKGAYGLASGEQTEATYILNNQLYELWASGEYAGLWGQYEQSGPPQGGG